jgi:GMP synthase-like glutamine amidotransferase
MAVLIFRHVPFEPAGRIADSLDERGIEWRYVDLWQSAGEPLPVDQAQALVVMGGPMSVNDPLPWLREEERYVTRAISSGVPVLGVCLGAQLLARCLGAQVSPMARKEIGWYPIRLREPAMADPLFHGLQPEEIVFHWHGESFSLPAGAEWLAESELCGRQAFRHGSNLYGLQFHPEVTPEIIRMWCREDANCGDLREAEAPIDPQAHAARMKEIAEHLFGRWCDLIVC